MATPRILLISHAAWRRTGYGAPVAPLVALLSKLGYSTVVLAVEERGPSVVEWNGIRHYTPHPADPMGATLVPVLVRRESIDAIVTLLDIWTMPEAGPGQLAGKRVPWLAWFPVDHTPPIDGILERARRATVAASFSAWGARQLREHGVPTARTIPYGVDLSAFTPQGPRAPLVGLAGVEGEQQARRPFVVGMVGTNLARDRKGLETAMKGFVLYARTNPDARLYMRTNPDGDGPAAKDLRHLRELLGAERIIGFPTHDHYYFDGGERDMAALYRSFDVLLQPSAAEGFGIPVVEALACGVPVVAADNSSLTELVPQECGELCATFPDMGYPGGWWRRTTPGEIAAKLERIHLRLTKLQRPGEIAVACRARAEKYSWRASEPLWESAMADLLR